jgi:N-ethylmaleimide reductase
MVAQLWHVGRISHVSLQPEGQAPVSSTARRANTKTFTSNGFVDVSTPRALRTDEIPALIASYRHAARCALDAGFDGVEVHGANGYLIEQFLRDSINDRSDAYGGSIANRARLLVEVMQAVAGEIGGGRTGLRLSPVTPANDAAQDSNPQALFEHALTQLAPLQLAFIEVVEGQTAGPREFAPFDYAALRSRFNGPWMVNNGYQRQMALDAVATGAADLVSFGRPFICNPDLVRRLRENAAWNALDLSTLYGGGAKGYTLGAGCWAMASTAGCCTATAATAPPAFFAAAIGGASEMALLAERHQRPGRPRGRGPLAAGAAGGGADPGGLPAGGRPRRRRHAAGRAGRAPAGLAVLLAASAAGMALLWRLGTPNPWVLGALASTLVLTGSGLELSALPRGPATPASWPSAWPWAPVSRPSSRAPRRAGWAAWRWARWP